MFSMWRLSWITFIFLPLTFIVGFFGMNVDTFAKNPSIKWYFIAAVPFVRFLSLPNIANTDNASFKMVSILLLYLIIKSLSSFAKPSPYQHGNYEPLFTSLSASYPTLWSRAGPRPYIQPSSVLARLKWRLINYWSLPGMSYPNPRFTEGLSPSSA